MVRGWQKFRNGIHYLVILHIVIINRTKTLNEGGFVGVMWLLLIIAVTVIGVMSYAARLNKTQYLRSDLQNRIRGSYARLIDLALGGDPDAHYEGHELRFSDVETPAEEYTTKYGNTIKWILGCSEPWEDTKKQLNLIYYINSAKQSLDCMRSEAANGDISDFYRDFQENIKKAQEYMTASETMLKHPAFFADETASLQQTGYKSQAQLFIDDAVRRLRDITEPCNQALSFAHKAGITVDQLGVTEQSNPIMWHMLQALAAAATQPKA